MRFIDGVGYVDIPDEKNDWYDVPSDEMTLEQARQAVKDLRKKLAEYLEQEPILDEIRVEIEALEEGITSYHDDRPWIFKDEVFAIIDKYKAESEKKE